jgi:uncharacterized protein involved in exopolysaccharide biosynthesis
MQNQDSGSIQRRTPDIEDYIDILRRHKAWILGPLMVGLVAGVVVAHMWPDTYVSTAVIRVVPPQVPERFVPSNVNAQIAERFSAMVASILSRSTLTNIITIHNLYPEAREKRPMLDIIEEMRTNDIEIVPMRSSGSGGRANAVTFQVSFRYHDRLVARRVTEELVTRFIDEHNRTRASQATQTTDFLHDKVEQAKKELDDADRRITEFRMRNLGQTPDQKTVNIQQLNSTELRISTLHAAISRVTQDKLRMEGELRSVNDKIRALSAIPTVNRSVTQAKSQRLLELDREILQTDNALTALRERYRDNHPDVRRAQSNLAALRKTRQDIAALEEKMPQASPQAEPVQMSPAATRELLDLQADATRIQGLIQTKDMEMEDLNRQIATLNRATKEYQSRIESSPANEQEYLRLMMDRQAASDQYEGLKLKMNASEIATDLENRKQGENLELLDQASLPLTHAEPNRAMIVGAGFIAGLIVGVMLAAAREVKDTSLKNLKDVRAYTQLTILGSVPLLENDLVIRRRRRLTWLAWSMASIVAIVVMAGSAYYYHFVVRT